MCGIVGVYYFDPQRVVTKAELITMADRMVHRGPDDAGYHVSGNIGLGMRRLSIIDLSGGHQPIYTVDRSKIIVFNGEVYNFQEERAELEKRGHTFTTHTDTEVVLHLYVEYGRGLFLDRTNGMYGLAIWDETTRELTIARDRLGIKPVYYYRDDEKLVFASEIRVILTHPGVRTELDMEGLSAYLRYGFTPTPYTLFRCIRKLPPAYLMRVRGQVVELEEYWRLSYRDKLTAPEEVIKGELYELLRSAVRYQMIADVPLGAFLSGGFDSSGIVHLMSEQSPAPVNTYSIGFGAGFDAYNELEAAAGFARDYRTNHHEILVTPDVVDLFPKLIASLDEPVADSSFLVTYLVAKLARETVKVILSGVGGDELFGGYRRYLNVSLDRYVKAIPAWLRRGVLQPVLDRLPADRNSRILNYFRLAKAYVGSANLPIDQQYLSYTSLFSGDALLQTQGACPDIGAAHLDACDAAEPLDRIMYYDLKMSLPDQLLMLTDKMTMATSIEARVPYLDHRVVEYAARIPTHMKVSHMQLRYIQKLAFRGRLPDYVYAQRKKGFGAPIGVWVRQQLEPMVRDLLGPERLREQGLFEPAGVSALIDTHFRREADNTDSILALLAFQVWCQQYGFLPA